MLNRLLLTNRQKVAHFPEASLNQIKAASEKRPGLHSLAIFFFVCFFVLKKKKSSKYKDTSQKWESG